MEKYIIGIVNRNGKLLSLVKQLNVKNKRGCKDHFFLETTANRKVALSFNKIDDAVDLMILLKWVFAKKGLKFRGYSYDTENKGEQYEKMDRKS